VTYQPVELSVLTFKVEVANTGFPGVMSGKVSVMTVKVREGAAITTSGFCRIWSQPKKIQTGPRTKL